MANEGFYKDFVTLCALSGRDCSYPARHQFYSAGSLDDSGRKISQKDYSISQIADGLTESDGVYTLSESSRNTIQKRFQWAMLLDENGTVIWSTNLPDDLPLKYSIMDVASFTRWYLNDYPVYVWLHPCGLFVLGSPKGSMWKSGIELPQKVMENTNVWIPAILILNGLAAMLLALLLGFACSGP